MDNNSSFRQGLFGSKEYIDIMEASVTDILLLDQPSESRLFFWNGCVVE